MRILILLPCNKYAYVGNYFLGTYWRIADKWRKKLGLNLSLGAIDCIPVFCKNEDDAIVLESEMHRVAGCDIYPSYDPDKVDLIARAIVNGLNRVSKDFDNIMILLNVKLYIEATKMAIRMLPKHIRDKIEFNYIYGYPGKFQRLIITKIKELSRDSS